MRQLFIKTDKTFIPSLPCFAFNGKIYVIQSESEALRAVEVLRRSPILGIDTETRPSFRKGETHKVALLQVANEQICFLFRMNKIGFLPCMAQLLADPQVLKVGLSLKDDFLMLRRRDSSFKPAGYIDLQTYAKNMGIEDMSLQKLYANVFHKRISKNAQLTNWEADVLTEAQKVYAATDAYTCIQLYKELNVLNESKNYELIGDTPHTCD
ncbi:MAG: 3'-5' exonuclease [Alloprevotella sp.]|nr:3'-5' exonuclease [Alloprevotella sp.]